MSWKVFLFNYIMKQLTILLSLFLILSCNSKNGNMIIKGKINNFQKGKVYLERIQDTILVKVDSVTLDGSNSFELTDNVTSPQIYYLSISDSDKYLKFFGEQGEIVIISDLNTFGYRPIIKGSKNQLFLDEYTKMNTKFNNLFLDLIKEKFEAHSDTAKVREIEKKIANTERRKYLYTINFAANHADYEIAPFLILTETPKVNPKLLDTIEKSLTENVKNSLYGKQFMKLMKNPKTNLIH